MGIKKTLAQSPEEQAEQARNKDKAQKINAFADKMSEIIRKEIWQANFEIGIYSVISEAIKKKTDQWFNSNINGKTMQDIVDDPTGENKSEDKKE